MSARTWCDQCRQYLGPHGHAGDIVGHKTFRDGGKTWHEPLTRAEADAIWERCKAAEAKRAADMPTVTEAIHALHDAYTRLKELGWREAIYCPKDRTVFEVIEPGSTGIHKCHYEGEWPKGSWWINTEDGDLSPSRPILFRPLGE